MENPITFEEVVIYFNKKEKNSPLTWNSEKKSFAAELSSLPRPVLGREPYIAVVDKSTGKRILFKYEGVDTDGSGEDIYGYRFVSVRGARYECKLLLIND